MNAMAASNDGPAIHDRAAAAHILEIARANRANAPEALSQMALGAIADVDLRKAMMGNRRLEPALRTRLTAGGALALPDQLEPFAGDRALLHLVRSDPIEIRRDVGLGWHANDLATGLIAGRPLGFDVPRDVLRRTLAHRDIAPAADGTGGGSLDAAAIERAGRLCLAAWCGSLPNVPAMIAMELWLMDAGAIRETAQEDAETRRTRRRFMSAFLHRIVPEGVER